MSNRPGRVGEGGPNTARPPEMISQAAIPACRILTHIDSIRSIYIRGKYATERKPAACIARGSGRSPEAIRKRRRIVTFAIIRPRYNPRAILPERHLPEDSGNMVPRVWEYPRMPDAPIVEQTGCTRAAGAQPAPSPFPENISSSISVPSSLRYESSISVDGKCHFLSADVPGSFEVFSTSGGPY